MPPNLLNMYNQGSQFSEADKQMQEIFFLKYKVKFQKHFGYLPKVFENWVLNQNIFNLFEWLGASY